MSKIVIIDDETDVLRTVKGYLEDFGFSTIEIYDILPDQIPKADVYIVDAMHGDELVGPNSVKKIRIMHGPIKIIGMSGDLMQKPDGDLTVKQHFDKAGANAQWDKDDYEKLIKIINSEE